MSGRKGGFGYGADYEIKSGGGSIAGRIDFVSSEQADSLIERLLARLAAEQNEDGSDADREAR